MGKHQAPRPITQRYAVDGQRIQGHNLPLGIQEILLDQVKQWSVWSDTLHSDQRQKLRAPKRGRGGLIVQDLQLVIDSPTIIEVHRIDNNRTLVKSVQVSDTEKLICVMALDAGIIKTLWYNALNDNHATLDKKLYINSLIPHTKKWEQLICCP